MMKPFLRIINVVTPPCDLVSFSVSKINAFMDPINHTEYREGILQELIW